MTATPIPRTLNMAMSGIKDISMIATPPPDRLSVRTFVCERDRRGDREAIESELARGGQIFFVHNRIETIVKVARAAEEARPRRCAIEVTHGQMDGEKLEQKMLAFYKGDAQILLTTTIIESGLDIPRANTILIDEAQNFGLAQLYQLRGRVGRSALRAYCYLLVPRREPDYGGREAAAAGDPALHRAGQRVQYRAATISRSAARATCSARTSRATSRRSGSISTSSFSTRASARCRGETKKAEIEPRDLDEARRLLSRGLSAGYQRAHPALSQALGRRDRGSDSEIETGDPRSASARCRKQVKNLLGLMTMKLFLKSFTSLRMSCGPQRTSLQFAPSTPASPEKLVRLIQEDEDGRYTITPIEKLVFTVRDTDWKGQLGQLKTICHDLGVGV